MVGRSTNASGPFVDQEGVLLIQGGGTQILGSQGTVIGPGGQNIFVDNGRDLILYHYQDATNNGAPRLAINELGYTADYWPYVI